MKLTIHDRITLLMILPGEGDFVTMRVLKKLKENLGFTEKEIKECNIVSNDGKITWGNASYVADIEIGEIACEIIKSQLKKLDSDKKITEQILPIYEMFIPQGA